MVWIMATLSLILLLNTLRWKVTAQALTYYIKKNKYRLPDEKEIKDCVKFVVYYWTKDFMPERR